MHLRVLTILLALGGCLPAFAQTGQFSGQVTDQQGAAVLSAEVQVINQGTLARRATKTDESGSYSVPFLPAGSYQVVIQASGFSTFVSANFTLTEGQATVLNVQLQLQSAQASISVEAGGAAQVETSTSEVSGTITSTEIVSLGLNGRNFTQLITLTPGVSNQTGQDEGKVGVVGSAKYSVNGGRVEYNTFEVDGSDVLNNGINASRGGNTLIVYPSLDALQEVKVLTSNYGAMYGRTASGTVLATTKSGAQAFHGNAYEFLRNELFNARNFFDQTRGAPLYRRNDVGYTIGGPLYIPGHYNIGKDKTFFFFSEEFRFEKTPQQFNQAVPSIAERNGDFSDACPTTNPNPNGTFTFTQAQFPDCPFAQIQAQPAPSPPKFTGYPNNMTGVNPFAAALLGAGLIPAPNSTTGCNSTIHSCYDATLSPSTFWREELFRIDHNFNAWTQLSFRFIHDAWNTTTLTPQWAVVQNSFPTVENKFVGPGLSLVARLTTTLSNTLLNQVAFSYVTDHITLTNVPGPGVNLQRPAILDAACAVSSINPAYTQCPLGAIFNNGFGGKIPSLLFQGNNAAYGGAGFAVDTSYMPWRHSNPTYSFRDDVTKTLGAHTLQFGVQVVIAEQNETSAVNGANSGDIQGLLTYSNEGSRFTSGNVFADFLIGQPTNPISSTAFSPIKSFQQDSAQFRYYNRYKIAEPYFQDDWRVNARLTLNLGLRFGLFGTWYNKDGTAFNWEPKAFDRSLAAQTFIDPSFGNLVDTASGVPLVLTPTNPDPRIINGLVQCGAKGVPKSCMKGHLFNPSPRIGFAWDPLGDGKTSLRGGYGIFFEHGTSYEANTGSLIGSAPRVLSETQPNPGYYDCIGGSKPGDPNCVIFQPSLAFPLNVTSIPTKAVYPYAQQWSLSAERELWPSVVATLAYVGSKGTHLTAVRQINQLAPLSASLNPFAPNQPITSTICSTGFGPNGFTVGNTSVQPSQPGFDNLATACFGLGGAGSGIDPNALRPFTGFNQILAVDNIADSHYHAFQATLRRAKGPLILGVAYTYSHSIDDSSDRADATLVNSFDLRSNRASSNFDQRHLLNISYIYKLDQLAPVFDFLFLSELTDDPEGPKPAQPNKPAKANPAPTPPPRTSDFTSMVFRGWELSGITTYQTGTPFSVVNGGSSGISSADNAGVANGLGLGSYADVIGGPHGHRPLGGNNPGSFGPLLLNPDAFAAPQGLTFGNAGRNSLNNPSRLNFDVALSRHFHVLGEKRSIEFRAEAFNVFNHTQFAIYDPSRPGNPGNNVISCYGGPNFSAGFQDLTPGGVNCLAGNSFLHPVDAHRPRTFQFGLKFAF